MIVIHEHGAEITAVTVVQIIKDVVLDLSDMKGQSFDSAANILGIYTGLQARIKAMKPLAYYTPCTGHSLNLVGTSEIKLFSFLTEYDSMKYDHLKAQLELVVSTYSSDLETPVLYEFYIISLRSTFIDPKIVFCKI